MAKSLSSYWNGFERYEMKKKIGILLSILMVLNIVIPVYANTSQATLSSNVSIGTETVNTVKRGDTITLTVSMQDCDASFKSLGLTLAYDESVFEFVETDVSGNANWTCPINGLFMSAYVAKNKNLELEKIDYHHIKNHLLQYYKILLVILRCFS